MAKAAVGTAAGSIHATGGRMMLIARTAEKESLSEDGVFWWKEFRLRQFRDEWLLEVHYLARVGAAIHARVDGKVALFTDPDSTWQVMSRAHEAAEAIDDYIGDSSFFGAESLCPLHAEAVSKLTATRQRNAALAAALERVQFAHTMLDEWRRERTREFNKRHGDKQGEAFAKAHAKTLARLKPEHDRIKKEWDDAKVAYEQLKESTGKHEGQST